MTKFLLGLTETTPVQIARKQVFFQCCFRLSDRAKESLSFEDVADIECDCVMGFYCDPVPGDIIKHRGLEWTIRTRIHQPTRRNTKDQKYVTSLLLDLTGIDQN